MIGSGRSHLGHLLTGMQYSDIAIVGLCDCKVSICSIQLTLTPTIIVFGVITSNWFSFLKLLLHWVLKRMGIIGEGSFFTYSVCVCVWAMLPDSNKMMMMICQKL